MAKNMRLHSLFLALGLTLLGISAGCSYEPKYVDIGFKWPLPWDEFQQIPYRLFDITDDQRGTLKQTTDMVGVVMDLQAGRGQGKTILFYTSNCYWPDVKRGLPTVRCSVIGGGEVFATGDQTVREKLLRTPSTEKMTVAVFGRIVGLLYGTPVVQVMP